MNRKQFLRTAILSTIGVSLFPKEIFSSPENKANLPVNDKLITNVDDIEIPEDLIKFAKHFSKNYKTLGCGTFVSDCGKYRIDYLHRIRDKYSKQPINTPYRVGHKTGIMEFSKSKMSNTPPSY
ncbi:MAG TPA: hypothetical protein VN026_17200, partial [Bacteroidia bacterium]|nr:hypothetical protein [Bacteroidia bacterium]